MSWYDFSVALDDDDDSFFAEESNFFGIDYFDLMQGKPIDQWNVDSFFRSTSSDDDGRITDVLYGHVGILTFSSRLREALANAGVAASDIQYLTFQMPDVGEDAACMALSATELAMLLGGIDLASARRRKRYRQAS